MKDNLAFIKECLFDAPAEVKAAYNEVVKYFALGKGKGNREPLKIEKVLEVLKEDEQSGRLEFYKRIPKGYVVVSSEGDGKFDEVYEDFSKATEGQTPKYYVYDEMSDSYKLAKTPGKRSYSVFAEFMYKNKPIYSFGEMGYNELIIPADLYKEWAK